MGGVSESSASRAAELRREFDRTFLAPPREEGEEREDLLAVRLAGDPYAFRVREIAGLEVCRRVVPLPRRVAGLCGLAGLRGGLVPVYDLGALLGYPEAGETPRWLILCGRPDPVGLGVAELDGYLRVPRSALHRADGRDGGRVHLREVVRDGGVTRGMIGVPALLETINGRAGSPGRPEER